MGRRRTWLALSTDGRIAYRGHVKALQETVGNVYRKKYCLVFRQVN